MRKRIISLRRLSLVIGAAFLFGTPAAYAASNNAPTPITAVPHETAASPVASGTDHTRYALPYRLRL